MTRNIIPRPLQRMTVDVFGIKCDHCDWQDHDVTVGDYKSWVNRPCPKCEHNLLTEHDYAFVQALRKITAVVNVACIPLMMLVWVYKVTAGRNSKKLHQAYEIKMDGFSDPKFVARD